MCPWLPGPQPHLECTEESVGGQGRGWGTRPAFDLGLRMNYHFLQQNLPQSLHGEGEEQGAGAAQASSHLRGKSCIITPQIHLDMTEGSRR